MTFDDLTQNMASLIEFASGLVVTLGCLRGLVAIARGRGGHNGIVRGRLLVADGVITALGFKTAATLLKTIELQSWDAILLFTATLALRTLVKRTLAWEEARLRGH